MEQGRWQRRRYLYFIWRDPYMVASRDTYISSLLDVVGFENMAPSEPRYPSLSVEALVSSGADLILLSTEPYPFRKRDATRLREEWPDAPEIMRIDGQIFSWHGLLALDAVSAMQRWMLGKNPSEIRIL